MKKEILLRTTCLILMCLCLFTYKMYAQDLVPGINYGYNPPGSDNVITDIQVDVCNNENDDATWGFDVGMYLYDQATTNYWVIGTTNLSNGLSGNSCITISNWDIDIDDTPNIPAGTYRLGLWVDVNDDISETDENNNAGLLSGNINYTPASTSGINDQNSIVGKLHQNFPNPVKDATTFKFELLKAARTTLTIYNATGQQIAVLVNEKLQQGEHSIKYNTENLATGLYYYTLQTEDLILTNKFIKS
jgi:hypothetical protein